MRVSRHIATVIVLATASSLSAQDKVRWEPNLEAAQRVAAQSNRLVLIHFWGPSCQPCLKMDREVFGQPETGKALDANFVPVKLNVDESPGTARLYGVSRIPADVIITPSGRLVAQFQSPLTASQYVTQMNQLADGHKELARSAYQQSARPPVQPVGPPTGAMASAPDAGSTQWQGPREAAPQREDADPYSGVCQVGTEYVRNRDAKPAAQDPRANAAPPHGDYEMQPPVVQNAPQRQIAQAGPQNAAAPNGAVANQSPPVIDGQPQVQPNQPQTDGQPPLVDQHRVSQAQSQTQLTEVKLPPGSPPLGLEGYCPVTLAGKQQWAKGDPRWGAIHRGRTYLFASPEEQKLFLANPDAYSPVQSGNDPVATLDHGQAIPGRREHGLLYQQRVYLFASEDSLQKFRMNPGRYSAEAMQATRPNPEVRK